MTEFKHENLSTEEAFWTMWYFLQEHHESSGGTFDVSDILSACEPVDWNEDGIKRPADSGMIDYWNDAAAKFKAKGIPDWKFKK